tara:strand:- start:6854 stop:7480 length:627 start_codon:yes stop_codon:yes gene_type:complete
MTNNLFKRVSSIFLLAPLFILCIYKGGIIFNLLLFLLCLIFFFEISKLNLVYTKLILILIFFLFLYSFYNIRNRDNGLEIVFLCTFITWLSDIGGYVSGKLIGGKKINFISPNKTISGYCGSVIFVQLNLIYIKYFKLNIFENIYMSIFYLLICTLVVVLGDLLFSYIKRLNKIKDYSNLIPGHGGLLDRIDGFIFLVIFFNIMYYYI